MNYLKDRERERKLEKIRGKARPRNGNGGNGRRGALGAFDFDAPRPTTAPPTVLNVLNGDGRKATKKAPRKKCPPKSRKKTRGTYDSMVTDPEHMPAKVAATFSKGLKKAIGRGSLVCIDDARSTATRGWDYGFAGTFDITLPDGAELRAMLVLHRAAHPPEVSGNVQLDAEYGGVIALARGLTWDGVLKSLIEQTGSHLKAGASK